MNAESKQDTSGRLWLDGDTLHHESTWSGTWSLPIAHLRVIGEMTNTNGPWGEDWIICFADTTDNSSGWFEAPAYAKGRESVLAELSKRLNTKMQVALADSCDFASNIMWPPTLAGTPMFDFIPTPPKGLLQRLKWLIGYRSNTQRFTDPVLAALDNRNSNEDSTAHHRQRPKTMR